MGGGTVVQGRNYVISTVQAFGIAAATGTGAVFGLLCPATGAEIVECTATVGTIGVSTTSATATFQLQDAAGVTLTAVQAAFSNSTAVDTRVVAVAGNGNSGGDAGARIIYSMTEAGTISAGSILDINVIWAL